MANSEIKHIDLASIGTTGSGVTVPGVKRKKSKDIKKSLGKIVKGVKGKTSIQSKGITAKGRLRVRGRR